MRDRFYMQMALALAARGRGRTLPNPLVGAVVVRDGRVVGRGWHERYGGPHAEVNALDAAGDAARGATLYVTLEPCNHTGQTPPCTRRILAAGIRRLVVATHDPNPGVAGGGNAFLQTQGIEVATGVCAAEAVRLNEAFNHFISARRPFTTLKSAATLDGRIATRTGSSRWVTGEASRRYVHELRHEAAAIMVGINTVRADNPSLTTRLDKGDGVDPTRIILDTALSIDPGARVLQQASAAATIVVAGPDAPAERRQAVEAAGGRLLTAPLHQGRIDLRWLMAQLGAMGLASLLVEGGSQVAGAALRAGIVDKLCLFYAPKLLGGDDGIPICGGEGPALMQDSLPVRIEAVHHFGEDLMVEAYLRGSWPGTDAD
ncbi:MAG: bifunctional diaminohydroxyphosphoribosylaminopyrimidine deaminase/5-amino-6-(5-phosphoribosylamino)uracil reductase RibD [Desulfobacterales bacterium]|nr:bifunctional diaminohydroxyphosphoribosylaminopyrimidine deaminase/5-amino-6-(5-phosphoribosylamino)uracil reductase RibD [Desulfobacterales bacterium]